MRRIVLWSALVVLVGGCTQQAEMAPSTSDRPAKLPTDMKGHDRPTGMFGNVAADDPKHQVTTDSITGKEFNGDLQSALNFTSNNRVEIITLNANAIRTGSYRVETQPTGASVYITFSDKDDDNAVYFVSRVGTELRFRLMKTSGGTSSDAGLPPTASGAG